MLPGATITDVRRRAKYLLMDTDAGGSAVLHLGMSGSLLRCIAVFGALLSHTSFESCAEESAARRSTAVSRSARPIRCAKRKPRFCGVFLFQALNSTRKCSVELSAL
ncbi:DNA-formamidopyrimidine glycosylase family protein [Xanthomonas campestris]|uniref:DNA-formamidopyrimidine glycosylase family protein n=1 Tax=Xanthomonas campestris TaxID=339 RepID=UPI003F6E15F0